MDANTVVALIALFSAVGAAVWTAASRNPEVSKLERRIDALEADAARAYDHDTTPAERAAVAGFVTALAPELRAKAAGDEKAVESAALTRAVTFASAHGLHLTAAEVASAVHDGLQESPVAAALQAAGAVAQTTDPAAKPA